MLCQPHLVKREDLDTEGIDWPAMFEGTSEDSASANKTPLGLCLNTHHSTSQAQAEPRTTFDVDSVCAFLSSLAVAQQGLDWFPQQYQPLGIKDNVHLGLHVPALNKKGREIKEWQPLHQIRHLCFGSVVGIRGLVLYFMFPHYNFVRGSAGAGAAKEKGNRDRTLITREDEVMLIDEIILLALYAAV